jgi:hypothetical protein
LADRWQAAGVAVTLGAGDCFAASAFVAGLRSPHHDPTGRPAQAPVGGLPCLNSDASVRRLKGPGRPVVSQEDRAGVLLALAAVDAVVVFDEDTPAVVLDRLRPDLEEVASRGP